MLLRLSFTIAAGTLILIFSVSASSQIAGGITETTRSDLGGRNYVSGTVFAPNGRPIATRLRVRLSTPASELITTTDDTGRFVISGLANGLYTLTIDSEEEFEPISQQFEISLPRGSVPQPFNVTIRLVAKQTPYAKPGVVSPETIRIPKRAQENYRKALAAANAGQHESATVHLKAAVKEYPEYLEAHIALGDLYQKLNDLENAAEHYRSANRIDGKAFDPLLNLGVIFLRLKQFNDAESMLLAALEVKNDSFVAQYYLGRAYAGLKKFDEAEEAYLSAIEKGGNKINEARRGLATLYLETGDDARAVAELEAYLSVSPVVADAPKLRDTIEKLKAYLKGTSPK